MRRLLALACLALTGGGGGGAGGGGGSGGTTPLTIALTQTALDPGMAKTFADNFGRV
jgi:hypothetical protein